MKEGACMRRYVLLVPLLFLLLPITGSEESFTVYEIEPHIGSGTVSVTQTYYLTQEGLTEFEALTISLSYADLRVFDDRGALDYEVGENVIIGRHLYRVLRVRFREPISSPYSFTISYWYPTPATGKPLTGKYVYNIINLTDSTELVLTVPLTRIKAASRSSPEPHVEYGEDTTVFSYHYSTDTQITLSYVPEEEIDYEDTQTKIVPFQDYSFEITYPGKADIFLEDVESFIETMFPVYLSETTIPLRYTTIKISLDEEKDTWAAAEYLGGGRIRVLINNTASYPSSFFAHELTHSHIGDFPRYLEEGIANYFEGRVSRQFTPPIPESYIPNTEAFFETFERQFDTIVDITEDRYGLGLTDHQEALIYAKYSKGTYCIYEIASVCGGGTVQEMLRILSENPNCSLNYVIANLTEGDQVYEILERYGFDVVPPHVYPAEELLEEVRNQSWWAYLLCSISGYESRISEADPQDIQLIRTDLEGTGRIASQTLWVMNGFLLVIGGAGGLVFCKKIYRTTKTNPRVVPYFYLVPILVALFIFGYFLYEFLFHGQKARWILENVLLLWGMGFLSGSAIIVSSTIVLSKRENPYLIEAVWSGVFFAIVASTAYFSMRKSTLLGLGYILSLLILFIIRRRHYLMTAQNMHENEKREEVEKWEKWK